MPKVTGLGHVGLYVKDPQLMIDFYTGFLGMTLTDRAEDNRIVFLSARPEQEHHELALVHDVTRTTDAQQISFTLASLDDLRAFYEQIVARGFPIDRVVNHGNAIGCYFRDPEGNRVEVYWHTGVDWPQPYGEEIDLGRNREELLAVVETMRGAPAAPRQSPAPSAFSTSTVSQPVPLLPATQRSRHGVLARGGRTRSSA